MPIRPGSNPLLAEYDLGSFGGGGAPPGLVAEYDLGSFGGGGAPPGLVEYDLGSFGGGVPQAPSFFPETHAAGGRVYGKGVAGNGEYVVNADAAARYLPELEAINNGTPQGREAPDLWKDRVRRSLGIVRSPRGAIGWAQPGMGPTGLWRPSPGSGGVDRETDQIDSGEGFGGNWWQSLLDSMPKYGGGGGGITAGHVTAGHATAGHATATHGVASLIDVNDPIYSLFAPKAWMSGMLSKGKEYLGAATNDNIRQMGDNATQAGVSTSSPAYMYMVSMQRREQQKALANALRDANLAWTLPAADRKHGALGQNAQNLTNVSMGNAEMDTNVSISNAGFQTQTSIANAGYSTQASMANASNRLSAAQANMANSFAYAQLGQQGWMYQTDFIRNMWNDSNQLAFDLLNSRGDGGDGGYSEPNYAYAGINGAFQGAQGALNIWDQIRGMSNPNRNRGGAPQANPNSYTGNLENYYPGGD